jgi:geranylgeranyl pyrophosphate synthase
MRSKGEHVNKKYWKEVTSDIVNPTLLTILGEVKSYWRDDFRTALTSLACEAVGGNGQDTYPISLVLSIAGSGIGIHDDIIDKTIIKRFRETVPGKLGSDFSLVAGDVLIVKGLTKIRGLLNLDMRAKKVFTILEVYEKTFLEMCEGEIMDIRFRGCLDFPIQEYHAMLMKLGVDAEACTRIGAIIGDGDEKQVEALSRYGRKVGYMNRLLDEIKDTLNVEGTLLNRIKNESIPLPLIYTSKKSPRHYNIIKKLVSKVKLTDPELNKLLKLCYDDESLNIVREIILQTINEANEELKTLPKCDARNYLKAITSRYCLEITSLLGV